MHPNPLYRTEDRALCESLIEEIGFGMVFAHTPDGPRVAHTPVLSTGDGAVQFHLARGNALARHLDELEGRVRRMADEGLEAFLHAAILKHEGRLEGAPWLAEESSGKTWSGLFRGIMGFELEVLAWRPTLKLSQNKTPGERAAIAAGLEQAGHAALAHLVRELPE